MLKLTLTKINKCCRSITVFFKKSFFKVYFQNQRENKNTTYLLHIISPSFLN